MSCFTKGFASFCLILGFLVAVPGEAAPKLNAAVILAAGKGTRMKSELPKVLHELEGKPMLFYILKKIKEVSPDMPTAVVVGYGKEKVENYLRNEEELSGMKITTVTQEIQNGTGNAVRCVIESQWGEDRIQEDAAILVLPGDLPLVTQEIIANMVEPLNDDASLRLLTCNISDPKGYGRVIRDIESQSVLRIVEEKDADFDEKKIKEVALSTYLFDSGFLKESIQNLTSDNAQGEYYLTDMIGEAVRQDRKIESVVWLNEEDLMNVNSQDELAVARRILRGRMIEERVRQTL